MKCDKCKHLNGQICRATLNTIKHETGKNGRCGTDGLLFAKRVPRVPNFANPRGPIPLRTNAEKSTQGRRKYEEKLEADRIREETEWLL